MTSERPVPGQVRFGRQAIRDAAESVVGQEVFFRDVDEVWSAPERATAATLRLLACIASGLGADEAVGPCGWFVNVTRNFLVGAAPLPGADKVSVLEVHPGVPADPDVVSGVGALRGQGYQFALDRYSPAHENGHDDLLDLASYVKLDLTRDGEQLRRTVRRLRQSTEAVLIGSRIETPELHDLARELGCELFQGSAVTRPRNVTANLVGGSLAAYVRLLELLAPHDDAVDLRKVTQAVMGDAELSLRVLRACNSAGSGLSRQVNSIQQAVVLLGVAQLRRRVRLALAQGLAVEGEDQLMHLIEYATLAELISAELGGASGAGFLIGLLAEVAETVGSSIASMIDSFPLAPELADQVRSRHGGIGRTLDLLEAYKQGHPMPAFAARIDLAVLHARAMLPATRAGGPASSRQPASAARARLASLLSAEAAGHSHPADLGDDLDSGSPAGEHGFERPVGTRSPDASARPSGTIARLRSSVLRAGRRP